MIDLRHGLWEDVLTDVADESVRLILTSPPYDNARDYEPDTPKGPVDFDGLARLALRVLMPGGTLAMVLDGAVNNGELSVTPFRVICDWAALDGWKLSQFLVYARQGIPGRYPVRFRKDHEPLIVFQKHGDVVCNKESARIAASCAGRKRDKKKTRRTRDGKITDSSSGKGFDYQELSERGSIWDYSVTTNDNSAHTGHPATFAEKFALDAVRVWSNPGELVADPFSGSGTVARACADLGRSFVGAEAAAKYHKIATDRLGQLAMGWS